MLARRFGATSVQAGLGQATSQGLEFKDDGKIPWQQVVLGHVIRQRKGNATYRNLARVAHHEWFLGGASQFFLSGNVFKSGCVGCAPSRTGSLYRERTASLGSASEQNSAPTLCCDKEETGTVNHKKDTARTWRYTESLEEYRLQWNSE